MVIPVISKNWDNKKSSTKNREKNLDSDVLFCDFFYDFLSLKNYVNVPSKRDKQKNLEKEKKTFFVSVLKVNDQDPDPDLLVRDTDLY
jgi:hypothetical protein